MNPTLRPVPIDIQELEEALEIVGRTDSMFDDAQSFAFLNLTTGAIVWGDDEDEEFWEDENLVPLPEDVFEDSGYGILDAFVDSLEDGPLRRELASASRGKEPSGASRTSCWVEGMSN